MVRRKFIRRAAAASAAAVAGIPLPSLAQNAARDPDAAKLKWSKAPCRFCGTGCGVTVGVKDNRVVATHGDVDAEVNKGLNCVKGYFLSKIMYGDDRLTTPLLRMKNGQYAKDGEFQAVSWDRAFDVMAEQWKRVLKDKGPTAVGMFGSGQWTIWEGYAALKLMKAGFRTNNLDPNARHCMASAASGFMRTFGADEPMGCYDDIEAADAFVLWGSNMAEMHPVLWTRVTDRRLSGRNVKVAVLSPFEHRSYELADIELTFTPQTDLAILNYIAHHIIKTNRVNRDFVDKHTSFRLGNPDIGYGLRPEHPLQKAAKNAGDAGFLTLGGFIGGILFWGAFNTAMELTNTETFCTGCHEMRDNVFAELKSTIHYTNRSGVRAVCSNCHVPHEWTAKMARKMQASKEVWGKIFGTIDTREKFQDKRLELARHEWARFKANDSLECRNCHDYDYMDFTRQSVRARNMHSTYLASKEKTCIDCHKGIAHRLPYIPPGEAPTDTPGQVVPIGDGGTPAPSTGNVASDAAR